jgi:hypothetical protein
MTAHGGSRRLGYWVNTRILSSPITGVQRCLLELLQRMPSDRMEQIAPKHPLRGRGGVCSGARATRVPWQYLGTL